MPYKAKNFSHSHFNSIKVRLKQSDIVTWDGCSPNFNSIKVRLKLVHCYFPQTGLTVFQFHKGTIKTALTNSLGVRVTYFNSIKVRLKQPKLEIGATMTEISIP